MRVRCVLQLYKAHEAKAVGELSNQFVFIGVHSWLKIEAGARRSRG